LVDEVLADEAVRLTQPGAPRVVNLAGYLVRAARHKLIDVRRAAARRQRRYTEAAAEGERADAPAGGGEMVVEALASEHARRASLPREPNESGDEPSVAV